MFATSPIDEPIISHANHFTDMLPLVAQHQRSEHRLEELRREETMLPLRQVAGHTTPHDHL
jgi:hypothetical protein